LNKTKDQLMPTVTLADGDLHYQLDGPASAPVLVLSNSLGTDLHMWDAQVPALSEHFRVLRYDTRGHGRSLVTPGPYSIEQHGRDVLAMLDALDLQRVHFCGLSMGGLIGQWLGINAPQRLGRLVVCNTAAKIGNPDIWNPRIEAVLSDGAAGMRALREGTITRWFTPAFAASHPGEVDTVVSVLQNTSPEGYAASCAAVRDADFREQIVGIKLPVLVVAGMADPVTTPDDGHFMLERIAGARMVTLEAAHLSSVEAVEVFSRSVLDFLHG
jgi:3-oxoadipate enol-lactonase